jgi:hypothetical protein
MDCQRGRSTTNQLWIGVWKFHEFQARVTQDRSLGVDWFHRPQWWNGSSLQGEIRTAKCSFPILDFSCVNLPFLYLYIYMYASHFLINTPCVPFLWVWLAHPTCQLIQLCAEFIWRLERLTWHWNVGERSNRVIYCYISYIS